ncbi:MAG: amidase [Pseudomonadota bacterium]
MKLADYVNHDALALGDLVRTGTVSAHHLANCAAEAIRLLNRDLNAVRDVYEDAVDAPDIEPIGPFAGVPFLLKDLSATQAGRVRESGSLMLKNYVAAADSEIVARMRASGLNLMGRTASPEFGWSASTESRLSGITRNPWNLARSAGGSSGGAAAAVAAGIVPIAHASDGSGSIRNPAGWCGLVGLKPSRGRISPSPGLGMPPGGRPVQFTVSRSLRDSAAALDAWAGPVPGDPFAIAPLPGPCLTACTAPPNRLRIAMSVEAPNGTPVEADVERAVSQTARTLENMGHDIVEAAPNYDWGALVDAILITAAAGIALRVDDIARMTGQTPSPDLLHHTTFETYRFGRSIPATELIAAMAHLDMVSRQVAPFFADHDLFLTPTSVRTAPPHGTHDADIEGLRPREWSDVIHNEDCFLLLANVTGQPAISLPLAESNDGLPIGIHLEAGFGREDLLFQVAGQLEQAVPWAARRPEAHLTTALAREIA